MQKKHSKKHKVFISYYHKDDQEYKDYLDWKYSDYIINVSVKNGEYSSSLKGAYIKRLIREKKLRQASVIVILIGNNTKYRKHIDWEIYAGLKDSINGSSGIVGILLPEFPIRPRNKVYMRDLPPRLADNIKSRYAKLYKWEYAKDNFKHIIDEAYTRRIYKNIDNSRKQMIRNSYKRAKLIGKKGIKWVL